MVEKLENLADMYKANNVDSNYQNLLKQNSIHILVKNYNNRTTDYDCDSCDMGCDIGEGCDGCDGDRCDTCDFCD